MLGCLVAGMLQGEVPGVAQRLSFERPERPTLVLVGVGLEGLVPTLRGLLERDQLLDFRVRGVVVREDAPGAKGLGIWLRRRAGLGPASRVPRAWALLGKEGNLLGAGKGLPGAGEVIRDLEAGERSPVAVLEDFLAQRPWHVEAARDLVQALRPRLRARLAVQSQGSGDLAPEADERIWGPMARALERLFRGEEWAALDFRLDGVLPRNQPERSSPRMKALYRRIRPGIGEALRRFPGLPAGWFNLLRLEAVLGEEDLVRVLEGAPWEGLSPGMAALIPFGQLACRVREEARQSGDWRGAAAILQGLWTHLAWPKLLLLDRGALMTGEAPEARREASRSERVQVWDELLAPLLEAKVRGGAGDDVAALLEELDDTWSGLGLEGRLERLARGLGGRVLPGALSAWRSILLNLSAPAPRQILLGSDLALLHRNQKPSDLPDPRWLQERFLEKGIQGGLGEAPEAWARGRGWDGASPWWALVDGRGRVLRQGTALPPGEDLLAAGRPEVERVEALLAERPDLLGNRAEAARLRGAVAWTRYSGRQRREALGSREALGRGEAPGEGEAWVAVATVLGPLLEDPLGLSPYVLLEAEISLPAPDRVGEVAGRALEALARRVLPGVEGELGRRPSDPVLWRLWLTLAPHGGGRLAELLERLEPSPLAAPGAFPPGGT